MIIGIAGKKNAGKDTVADYIVTTLAADKKIQIKKIQFADKLKDMVCLLLNCNREELEDREFKEKELGEEWWYYKFDDIILPISDKRLFIQTVNSQILSPLDEDEVDTYIIKLTPRLLLQLLGTECGRKIIHPDIWVNATFAKYKPLYAQYGNVDYYYNLGNCKYECKYKGDYFELTNGSVEKTKSEDELISLNATKVYYEHPNWVISDMRFPNEAKAIKDKGGILIRINRPEFKNTGDHPSEISLDTYKKFDYTITNAGTTEDLYAEVDKVLKTIKEWY